MSGTHTPGPWCETRDKSGIHVWQFTRECQSYPQRVATLTDRGTGQQQANARLIAAAPEMLAALKCARHAIDGKISQNAKRLAAHMVATAIEAAEGETE